MKTKLKTDFPDKKINPSPILACAVQINDYYSSGLILSEGQLVFVNQCLDCNLMPYYYINKNNGLTLGSFFNYSDSDVEFRNSSISFTSSSKSV